MAEKQHEALDECDLNQNVSQTDGHEIKERNGRLTAFPAFQGERQNQKCQHRDQRNSEHEKKHQNSEIYFPIDACMRSFFAENLPQLKREEEERRIVGYGRGVVRVAASKCVRIIARDEIGKRILLGVRR